jgi:radical SAM/Cys-rich protein
MGTLNKEKHLLANSEAQINILQESKIASFEEKIAQFGYLNLKPTGIDILQVNVGKMCNQTCNHCHVDAGPDRKEIMIQETLQLCLDAVDKGNIKVVDITGGAPEMNPHFRWFVEELSDRKVNVMVRSNLTIILANPKYNDLPEFFKKHKVEVISSLPHFSKLRTDAQRGEGVFEKSIKALQMLNSVGYGVEGSGLILNLVFNPAGALMPPSQSSLERDFKERLSRQHEVTFNSLFAITNMPISRFLDYLLNSGNYESYMEELANGFNPIAVDSLMCRNMLSVGWDGYLFDCDFNQMLDLKTNDVEHIKDFDREKLAKRLIKLDQHCYGCTAGSGSSCGGEIACPSD